MNEENESDDPADRRQDADKHCQVWDEIALVAAEDGAQHDQAIGENAREHSEHDLRDCGTHEVPQDVRGVWLDASIGVIKVIENVIPTTVIIEPAIVDNIRSARAATTSDVKSGGV